MRCRAVLFLAFAAMQVQAQGGQSTDWKGNDLVNCVWANGSSMSDEHCRQARREEKDRTEYQQRLADQKKVIEDARRSREQEEVDQKKKCGKDFGKLRVGMTLARYEQCTEAVDYVTKTVTKDGEVETYLGTFYLINAVNGRIVSFTRRTN